MPGIPFKSNPEIFYSPAQVTIYIGRYLIEDAVRVRYAVVDNWTPVYGYNSRLWDDLAMGQTLVQGDLAIVFREEGYLRRVVHKYQQAMEYLAQNPDQVAAMRKGSARSVTDEMLQQDAATLLRYLDKAAEGSPRQWDLASEFLKSRFWPDAADAGAGDLSPTDIQGGQGSLSQEDLDKYARHQNRYRPSTLRRRGLSLRIVHGPDENVGRPQFARDLTNLQFTGQSYDANIEVPNGSRPVTEVYPFIAREVRPVTEHGIATS